MVVNDVPADLQGLLRRTATLLLIATTLLLLLTSHHLSLELEETLHVDFFSLIKVIHSFYLSEVRGTHVIILVPSNVQS